MGDRVHASEAHILIYIYDAHEIYDQYIYDRDRCCLHYIDVRVVIYIYGMHAIDLVYIQ